MTTRCRKAVHLPNQALIIALLAMTLWATSAKAAETTITLRSTGHAPVDMEAPIGIPEAIKLALAKSEALRTTQLDIETSKIDERTMWYRLFPKLHLLATYSVPVIQDSKNKTEYKSQINIMFTSGTYDPIAAHVGHGSSRVAVKLSEVLHVIAIQDMIERINAAFVDIDTISAEISIKQQIVDAIDGFVQHSRERYASGSIASLDHRIAEQRLNVARLELRRTIRKRELLLMHLKQLIGVDVQEGVQFATVDTAARIDPLDNLDDALQPQTLLSRNLSLKAQTLRAKLEEYNITLAKSEHLPKFAFGFQTPDSLSNPQGHLPYYASLQTSLPIWAWGETVRNTDRARLRHQSAQLGGKQMLHQIRQTAAELREGLDGSTEALSLARTKEELQRLELSRKEIGYTSGSVKYADLVAAREAALVAKLETLRAQQGLNHSLLRMQSITGSLISKYVAVNYGELEED